MEATPVFTPENGVKRGLAALLVDRVLALELAVLFDFEAAGSVLFLLGRRIVSAFALGAFKNNDFAHGGICFLRPAESFQCRRSPQCEQTGGAKSP